MLKQEILLILFLVVFSVDSIYVQLINDGPIVKGGTIHFYATVFEGNQPSTGAFKYEWEDNAINMHTRQSPMQNSTDQWTVTYEADKYPIGSYIVQVSVKTCVISEIICYEVGSSRTSFNITGTLNGNMALQQKNETIETNFVSNMDTVIHEIVLKQSDKDYIDKAPTVLTYWFVDCTYYGITTDLKFQYNFTKADEEHFVEALVMADFTPLPPSTTVAPTTTTRPTTTTSKPTPTTKTTTIAPPTSATTKKSTNTTVTTDLSTKSIIKRSISDNITAANLTVSNSKLKMIVNGTLVPYNVSLPYICNGSVVTSGSVKAFGFFRKRIKVKAPVSNVNVTGNNWIQQGDLLSLQVSCKGSKNLEYCVKFYKGAYNYTKNETCFRYKELDNNCEFPIQRYLAYNKSTVLIIIKNEVSKVITPVAVTVYKVKKQAQLSVIVVPVSFSLVAVVLIVFGIAYYIQNRSRFLIEVADFNFGQQYSDMEYKTFSERLRESITNAFTRGPTPSSSEVPVWPPGSRKYGSML